MSAEIKFNSKTEYMDTFMMLTTHISTQKNEVQNLWLTNSFFAWLRQYFVTQTQIYSGMEVNETMHK